MKGLMKGGWHPSKDKSPTVSARGDFKGVNQIVCTQKSESSINSVIFDAPNTRSRLV